MRPHTQQLSQVPTFRQFILSVIGTSNGVENRDGDKARLWSIGCWAAKMRSITRKDFAVQENRNVDRYIKMCVAVWGKVFFLKEILFIRCRLKTFQCVDCSFVVVFVSQVHLILSLRILLCKLVNGRRTKTCNSLELKHATGRRRTHCCCYWIRLYICLIHKELIIRLPLRIRRLLYILICSKF